MDPDPEVLVKTISTGQYDKSDHVATCYTLIYVSPSTHIALNIGAIKEGLHTIPR